jgi:hypothetical protein
VNRGNTVVIVESTFEGIPDMARCETCGAVWTRPAGDPGAASLEFFALVHRDCPDPMEDR